jgi:hypothetical protein
MFGILRVVKVVLLDLVYDLGISFLVSWIFGNRQRAGSCWRHLGATAADDATLFMLKCSVLCYILCCEVLRVSSEPCVLRSSLLCVL